MQHLFVLALEVDKKDYDDFFWSDSYFTNWTRRVTHVTDDNDDFFWSDSYFTNWTRRVTHVTDDKTGLGLGLSYVMTGVKKNGIVTQIFYNV